LKTKIFCDIAELDQIKKFNKKKIVKGFTTNPSLMRKAGAKDYKSYSKKILKFVIINLFHLKYLLMNIKK
jgi:transaldolase